MMTFESCICICLDFHTSCSSYTCTALRWGSVIHFNSGHRKCTLMDMGQPFARCTLIGWCPNSNYWLNYITHGGYHIMHAPSLTLSPPQAACLWGRPRQPEEHPKLHLSICGWLGGPADSKGGQGMAELGSGCSEVLWWLLLSNISWYLMGLLKLMFFKLDWYPGETVKHHDHKMPDQKSTHCAKHVWVVWLNLGRCHISGATHLWHRCVTSWSLSEIVEGITRFSQLA